MGFGSGVDIFDDVQREIVEADDLTDAQKTGILVIVIKALENHDWDTQQDDSGYYDEGPTKEAFKKVHPDWFGPVPAPENPRIGDTIKNNFGGYWEFTDAGWVEEWD